MSISTALERVSDCAGVREFQDEDGHRTYLNVAEHRFVLLREPDFAEVDRLVEEFKERLHRAVVAYMARSEGFNRADGESEHAYFFAMLRGVSGRRNAPRKLNHEFVILPVLRETFAADGRPVPKGDVTAYITDLRSLPLDHQKRLIGQCLGPDLDTLVTRLTWEGRTRLAEVRTINRARAEAKDPITFLRSIADYALRYISASDRAKGVRREGRRGDSDSYDIATVLLLLAWFRRHGVILFPVQHLDTRLFGVFSLSWGATRVDEIVPLHLNDAEAEIYEYLHVELEAGTAFKQAKAGGAKGKGGRRKAIPLEEMGDTTPESARAETTTPAEATNTETKSDRQTEEWERQAYGNGKRLGQMRSMLANVFLKSSMTRIGPILRDVMDASCEKIAERGQKGIIARHLLSDAFRVIQNRYHEAVGTEPLVGTKRRMARAKNEHLFPWASDANIRRPVLLKGYTHDARVAYWADVMNEAIRADAENTLRQGVRNMVSHVHHFLRFVWQTPSFPSNLLLVVPSQHINDGRAPEKSECFRAYLARSQLKTSVKNQVINTLSAVFRAHIKRKGLRIDNPVEYSADKFKEPRRRGKTARPYIGRNHLIAIRDLNAADDFALSRSFQSHTRRVWDPDRKQWVHVWWPGIGIFFDFLLSVPLRSFARFVDSGEGDEFLVDPVALGDMIPNTAPWAERGRQEGIFYIERPDGTEEKSNARDFAAGSGDDVEKDENASEKNAPFVGLYINTNKSGTDENGGFQIPWCPDNVTSNLSRLLEWQRKFNPIRHPIPCLERATYETLKKAGQDLTIEARTKSFPLFRDPANDDNWPVSKAVIDAYWAELLWAYQQMLGTSKKRQRQFARLVKKDGRPVKIALIDIHTLRVSGISSLIESGVPPDIVQQVVGHYTLVMTLYYSKQHASRVNRILRQKITESRFDPVQIENLSDHADFEDLLQWLINNRPEEDAAGVEMYRDRFGRGDGSVHVMEHGVCPGGRCDTGGEFIKSANTHGPVPPFACPLCRYRLTGPMFLVGLVHNANRLMLQYRRIGEEISRVNAELGTFLDEHPEDDAPELEATLEMLYRQSEPLALQWFAERSYVEVATRMMSEYLSAPRDETSLPALITGLNPGEIKVAIEERPAFVLLQDLVEGVALLPGVRAHTGDAVQDHREFLNQVLAANDLDPFLLRMPVAKAREEAASILGAALLDLLSDRELIDVAEGRLALGNAEPLIADLAKEMSDQVRSTKTIDLTSLLTLQRIADKAERVLVGPGTDGVLGGEVLAPAE